MVGSRSYETKLLVVGALLGLSGCAREAPSFILFGAYFPAWMLCALFGILGAIAIRLTMVVTGLSQALPFQLFVCMSIGLIVAIAVWLVWFEQGACGRPGPGNMDVSPG
jgi:hypothetical protein